MEFSLITHIFPHTTASESITNGKNYAPSSNSDASPPSPTFLQLFNNIKTIMSDMKEGLNKLSNAVSKFANDNPKVFGVLAVILGLAVIGISIFLLYDGGAVALSIGESIAEAAGMGAGAVVAGARQLYKGNNAIGLFHS